LFLRPLRYDAARISEPADDLLGVGLFYHKHTVGEIKKKARLLRRAVGIVSPLFLYRMPISRSSAESGIGSPR
jgi:hypothetical protein